MNWHQVGNMWQRVKDGAESAWDRVADGLGRATETARDEASKTWRESRRDIPRRAREAMEPWRSHGFGHETMGARPGRAVLLGATLGAGLMYMLDPQQGRRRRALARDQVFRALNKVDDGIGVLSRDMSNRARGLWAETRAMPGRLIGESVSDDVLHERVRSSLGRVVSRPRAIEVQVKDGCVTLSGHVLYPEADRLLRNVNSVPGVGHVENHLEIHKSPGDVPELQGARPLAGDQIRLIPNNWSPTARLVVGAIGGFMLIGGAERGGPTGWTIGGLGAGLLARATTNIPIREWAGPADAEPETRDLSQEPPTFEEKEQALAQAVS